MSFVFLPVSIHKLSVGHMGFILSQNVRETAVAEGCGRFRGRVYLAEVSRKQRLTQGFPQNKRGSVTHFATVDSCEGSRLTYVCVIAFVGPPS